MISQYFTRNNSFSVNLVQCAFMLFPAQSVAVNSLAIQADSIPCNNVAPSVHGRFTNMKNYLIFVNMKADVIFDSSFFLFSKNIYCRSVFFTLSVSRDYNKQKSRSFFKNKKQIFRRVTFWLKSKVG